MDKLSQVLQNLEVNADVFFSGSLCGISSFDEHENASAIHFLEQGTLKLTTSMGHSTEVNAGSVIFFPSGCRHSLRISQTDNAKLVCATVKMPLLHKNILTENLPVFLHFNLNDEDDTAFTAQQIFSEAFADKHGRQMMINRLCDIFILQMLRSVLQKGTMELSTLAADSHKTLSPLIKSIRMHPENEWSVESMANTTAMSRSKFAAFFKETVGQSPMEYVTSVRMQKAQDLLKKNRPVAIVANEVGYESASSLSKVFKKQFGITPKQWVKSL